MAALASPMVSQIPAPPSRELKATRRDAANAALEPKVSRKFRNTKREKGRARKRERERERERDSDGDGDRERDADRDRDRENTQDWKKEELKVRERETERARERERGRERGWECAQLRTHMQACTHLVANTPITCLDA